MIRAVRRNFGSAALVVLTMAVGIGATTAAMNVAANVLLTSLPVADESRLVLITKRLPSGSTLVPFSYGELAQWTEASQTLAGVAGVQYDGAWPWSAVLDDRVLTVTGTAVSGNLFSVLALGLFAVVAVLLVGVGVFGVLGAFVAQRSRELGVRVALGAVPADLRRLVLSKLGWPVAVGLFAGTGAVVAAAPLIRPLLFQVTTFDARAVAAGWTVLALASAGASFVPVRRASRIDPATLLRSE